MAENNNSQEEVLISDITKLIWFGWKSPSSPLSSLPREIIRQITLDLYAHFENSFGVEDDERNIRYSMLKSEKRIKTATLVKLIEKLTEGFQLIDASSFILTYKTFATATNVFDLLVARFWMLPPAKLTQPEYIEWKNKILKPIRFRVLNFFRLWINKLPEDFIVELRPKMFKFINKDLHASGFFHIADSLSKSMDREPRLDLTFTEPPPKPIEPKKENNFSFLDFDAEELARQITILDFATFKKIRPMEFLGCNWSKQDKLLKSPNVCALIARFQFLSAWVTTEIVSTEDMEERVQKIIKFIQVADKCGQLNNIHAVAAIISSMDTHSLNRLKHTWDQLPSIHQQTKDTLRRGISRDRGFSALRQKHTEVKPPAIPYLGLYLTDLMFLEEANSSDIDHMINWQKRERIAGVLNQILSFQMKGYNLQEVPVIQRYLASYEPLPEVKLVELSYQWEPGENK